jgi:hypothetical protein
MKLIAALSFVFVVAACSGADGTPIPGPGPSGNTTDVGNPEPQLAIGPGAQHQFKVQVNKALAPVVLGQKSAPESNVNGCTDKDFVEVTAAGDVPTVSYEQRADAMFHGEVACVSIMKFGHVSFLSTSGLRPALVGPTTDGSDPFDALPASVDAVFPTAGDFGFAWGENGQVQHGVIRVKDFQ